MRLSANVLQSAEQRTNPQGEREILLRSLAIPAIEHLAVTRDQFDVIDLSNNHLSRLENFPKLERLNCLYLGGNGIDYVDGTNLKRNVPCLRMLILTGNGIRGWNVIGDLGLGCPRLEFLSLVGNPVTSKFCPLIFSFVVRSCRVFNFRWAVCAGGGGEGGLSHRATKGGMAVILIYTYQYFDVANPHPHLFSIPLSYLFRPCECFCFD
jgi:U2 small nuclear ribonucleoprotein A'